MIYIYILFIFIVFYQKCSLYARCLCINTCIVDCHISCSVALEHSGVFVPASVGMLRIPATLTICQFFKLGLLRWNQEIWWLSSSDTKPGNGRWPLTMNCCVGPGVEPTLFLANMGQEVSSMVSTADMHANHESAAWKLPIITRSHTVPARLLE